jgi:hypothetical protein
MKPKTLNHEPLLGQVSSLDDVFLDYHVLARPTDGLYFLGGLPGSVDIKTNRALYALPRSEVIDALTPHMVNGEVGCFRARFSEWWSRAGVFPVWAHDSARISQVLLCTVPLPEYDRYNVFAGVES